MITCVSVECCTFWFNATFSKSSNIKLSQEEEEAVECAQAKPKQD